MPDQARQRWHEERDAQETGMSVVAEVVVNARVTQLLGTRDGWGQGWQAMSLREVSSGFAFLLAGPRS